MITTPDLIAALAANLTPVRRLRPPLARATGWIVIATAIVALLGVAHGLRSDIVQRVHEPTFVTSAAAAIVTGVLAAIAVFYVSQPDRSRAWLMLPLPPLLLWMCTLSYGCLTDWVSIGPAGMQLGETLRCFATLLLISLPLGLAMFVMVRRAVPIRATAVSIAGGIAVGGFTATALSLLHDLDASAMVLMWNLGTTLLFAALGGVAGRRILDDHARRSGYQLHG